MLRKSNRGQNLAEFALGLAVILGVFMAMRVYIQRGLQARYHDGMQFFFSQLKQQTGKNDIPSQFEPNYALNSEMRSVSGAAVEGRSAPNLQETVSSGTAQIDEAHQIKGWQTQIN